MIAALSPFPSIEIALVMELTEQFGDDYRFCTILPDNLGGLVADDVVVTRIKRITGASRNYVSERPIVDIDTFSTSYGTSDMTARQIQATLFNIRGKRLQVGVIQQVIVTVGPRWLPDPAPQFFRFSQSHEFLFHAGGRTA
jgi:hypothetical protein